MMLLFLVLFLFVAHSLAVPWVPQGETDAGWVARHKELIAQTNAHRDDIKCVFFGDSIVEKYANEGKPVWDAHYAPRYCYNYGIGGDRVENLLFRLADHELDGINPKVVVLEIGCNNIQQEKPDTPQDVARGIKELIQKILLKFSMTKIILIDLVPSINKTQELQLMATNPLIQLFADNIHVFWLPLTPHFQTSPGNEKPGLFISDGEHFSTHGFQLWYEIMEPLFKRLLG